MARFVCAPQPRPQAAPPAAPAAPAAEDWRPCFGLLLNLMLDVECGLADEESGEARGLLSADAVFAWATRAGLHVGLVIQRGRVFVDEDEDEDGDGNDGEGDGAGAGGAAGRAAGAGEGAGAGAGSDATLPPPADVRALLATPFWGKLIDRLEEEEDDEDDEEEEEEEDGEE